MKKKLLILLVVSATIALFTMAFVGTGPAASATDFNYCPGAWTGPGSDGCLTMQQLAMIQPGLGTVMVEVGHRADIVRFAAKAGNWNMAKYQLEEMDEIMEVGTITRPGRAAALLAFMDDYGLPPVEAAVEAHDYKAVNSAYTKMVNDCNACHASQKSAAFPDGYGFIKYKEPNQAPADLDLTP